jgi:hypothetical protein
MTPEGGRFGRVADSIAELGDVQVMDVIFRTELTGQGDRHSMSV